MTNVPIENLGRAIAGWIEFKRLSGFRNLFSEALLAVAVAEFLIGNSWEVEVEQDYRSIFGTGKRGYFNYDLVARKGEFKCIVEIKFLKPPKKTGKGAAVGGDRVFDDILKLALPEQRCQRLLILGRDQGANFTSRQTALFAEPKRVLSFDFQKKCWSFGEQSAPVSDTLLKPIKNTVDWRLPSSCRLERRFPAEGRIDSVAVLSVERPNRSD